MITIPSPVDGIVIERDLRENCWRLSLEGRTFRLRPWSWGERRGLVECATLNRVFDPKVLAAGVVSLSKLS